MVAASKFKFVFWFLGWFTTVGSVEYMMKGKLTIVYILLSLLVCFGSARLSLPQGR